VNNNYFWLALIFFLGFLGVLGALGGSVFIIEFLGVLVANL